MINHEEFVKTARILANSNLAKELAGTHEGIHFASALWAGGKTLALKPRKTKYSILIPPTHTHIFGKIKQCRKNGIPFL